MLTIILVVEVIGFCLKLLYHSMLKAVLGVEYSFYGKMYKQVDGVAIGSPLGPILANIFVGYL